MGIRRRETRPIVVEGRTIRWRVGRNVARHQYQLGTAPVVIQPDERPPFVVHVTCRDIFSDNLNGRDLDPAVHRAITPHIVREIILAALQLDTELPANQHFRWRNDEELVPVDRDFTILEGDRLFGWVDRVEHYGLYVDVGVTRALLLIPELSWSRISHPSEVANVRDEVEFVVQRLVPETEAGVRLSGSIRMLEPDPWRDPTAYRIGEEFTAPVWRVTGYGYWLQHSEHVPALLRIEAAGRADYVVGSRLRVRITGVDLERRHLEVVEDP